MHRFVHSLSKDSQHFWSCLSFGKECIPMNLGLCRFPMTPGHMRSHDPGPQEKSRKKNCVSFETECKYILLTLWYTLTSGTGNGHAWLMLSYFSSFLWPLELNELKIVISFHKTPTLCLVCIGHVSYPFLILSLIACSSMPILLFLLYTLPQNKRRFLKVAFLLGKSVSQWTWPCVSFT